MKDCYQSVRDAYNAFADQYHQRWPETWRGRDKNIIDKWLSGRKTGGTVLELGCGDGTLTSYISNQGFEAAGIDISEKMLSSVEKKQLSGTFICQDICTYKYPRDFYDGIISRYTLQYLTRIDLQDLLSRLKDSLTVTGSMLLFIHFGEKTHELKYKWPNGADGGTMYLMSEDDIQDVLGKKLTGFDVLFQTLNPPKKMMGDYLLTISQLK